MSPETLANLCAAVMLLALMAYAILGGADFGGGVWSLFATGPRREAQQDTIAHAMGPVWEANHVWLIFLLVILFTCFPDAYAALSIAFFLPFHIALAGIMLRGAAFVFRAHASSQLHVSAWSHVFGIASVITPLLLGAAFGAITAGSLVVGPDHQPLPAPVPPWLRPYSLTCGLLALATCAYLAAVYLAVETAGDLREDFRRRAILAGTTTAFLAIAVLYLAYIEANWFFDQLTSLRASPVLGAGLLFFILSAYAVFSRRYRLARFSAIAQVILLLAGWGLAQRPYLIYPDFTIASAAGPPATLRFILLILPLGALLLAPSLYLLFSIFKRA